MKCPICKHGETRPGETTVTLESNGSTVIFKRVPAEVCEVCGESYLDEITSAMLLEVVGQANQAGVEVDVRDWSRAAVLGP